MANKFLIVCGGSGAGLLGQRGVLGANAELHIDVGSEIAIPKGDSHSLFIELDKPVNTVAQLLLEMGKRVTDKPADAGSSAYIQTSISQPADRNHLQCLSMLYPTSHGLGYGLAQSPVVGGAAIRHPSNVLALRTALSKMISEFAINPGLANPIDAWIISSSAGGTGEGIHRFTAACLADTCKTRDIPVTLNFIRVGALTYQSVNAEKTSINTFFGLAADAAFELKLRHDFPGASINWFYIDMPDVGSGNNAKPIRADMVATIAKAIMLDDLTQPLQTLLANNMGIRTVCVRVGFWGRDFDERLKYKETLQQLKEKLNLLISPDPSRLVRGQPVPDFRFGASEVASEVIEQIRKNLSDDRYIKQKLEEDWKFPKYSAKNLKDRGQVKELLSEWNKSIEKLTNVDITHLRGAFYAQRKVFDETGQERVKTEPLVVTSSIGPGEDWFARIDEAQRAKAWCLELLGTGLPENEDKGLLAKLHKLAGACSRVQHPPLYSRLSVSTAQQAKGLSESLSAFFETLVKVNCSILLEDTAASLLDACLGRPKEVLKMAQEEYEIAARVAYGMPESPVTAAELNQQFDRLQGDTWLTILGRVADRKDKDLFKKAVLRGAIGLTLSGLKGVLGLEPTADLAEINTSLGERMGRMYSMDRAGRTTEFEAPWWGSRAPDGITREYNFRILPVLERGLTEALRASGGQEGFSWVFTKLGVIGLHILAFHGVSLNTAPGPDTISATKYLMEPYVEMVRRNLERWDRDALGRSGEFEIALAGVIGEPLYLKALVAAELTEEELEKIRELYQVYEGV
ncbi:MAG: hypothetical protein FJ005_08660 [Chloroflexi bacterium]|nr:hypothetical protein [Chloroflexota bacterium]